jgi:O-antigen/teichoic acid export membrane protein
MGYTGPARPGGGWWRRQPGRRFFGSRGGFIGRATQALATSVAIQTFNLVTGIVLARSLLPTARGTLAAAILWPGLLSSLVALGVADAITYRSSKQPHERGTLIVTGLLLAAGSSFVAIPIGLVALPRLLSHYGPEAVISSELFLLYVPLYLSWQNLAAVLLGALHTVDFNVARTIQVGLAAVGIVLLAAVHEASIRGFIVVYLLANTGTLGFVVWRVVRLDLHGWRPSVRVGRAILSFGVRSHLGTVSGMTNEYVDQAVISVVLPAAQLAYYAIAVSIVAPLALIGSSLGMMAMPSVASQAEARTQAVNLSRYARVTFAIEVGLGIVVIAMIPLIIAVLFGYAYGPAAGPARILVVAAVFLGTNRILSAGLRAVNRPLTAGNAELLASVVTVAGLIVFIPRLGIIGAAITSLMAYVVATAFLSWALNRVLGVSPTTLLIARPSDFRTVLRRLVGREPAEQ